MNRARLLQLIKLADNSSEYQKEFYLELLILKGEIDQDIISLRSNGKILHIVSEQISLALTRLQNEPHVAMEQFVQFVKDNSKQLVKLDNYIQYYLNKHKIKPTSNHKNLIQPTANGIKLLFALSKKTEEQLKKFENPTPTALVQPEVKYEPPPLTSYQQSLPKTNASKIK